MRVEPASPGRRDTDERSRAAALLIVRGMLFVLVIAVTLLGVLRVGQQPTVEGDQFRLVTGWQWAVAFALALAMSVLLVDLLTPRKKLSTLSGVFLGLLTGLAATIGVSFLVDLMAQGYRLEPGEPITTTIKVLFGVGFCYLGVSVVLQTQDDFRLVIPYVEFAKEVRGARPLLLDSSALIDGRIFDLGETGLVQSPVLIPRFVVDELQTLADSSDRGRRSRGRRGLEMVTRMQRSSRLDVSVAEVLAAGKSVDQMLIDAARTESAVILTTDSGLERVASINNVPVVNLTAVAAALRPSVMPGESVTVRILKPGEQPGQGVGYLDDGAMVVVENGAALIGEERTLTITGAVQTSAGRLVFARLPGDAPGPAPASAPGPSADAAAEPDDAAGPGPEPIPGADATDPDPAAGPPEDPSRRPGPFPPRPPSTRRAGARNPRR